MNTAMNVQLVPNPTTSPVFPKTYIPVITTKSLEVNQTSSSPIKAFNESPPACQKPLPHTAAK